MESLSTVDEIELNDKSIVILYFIKKWLFNSRNIQKIDSFILFIKNPSDAFVDSPLKFELLKSLSRHEYHKTQMKLLQHVWGTRW